MVFNGKNLIFILLALLLIVIILPEKTMSYKTDVTHPAFVSKVVELYNKFYPNDMIDRSALLAMQWGSMHEDQGAEEMFWGKDIAIGSRYSQHFLDPTTGKGFKGWVDSLTWAFSPELQADPKHDGDYSWPTAINKYKSGDKIYAYKALGHILHLIHDLTVPAHTRDDLHYPDDPYEKWIEDNWNTILWEIEDESALAINMNNLKKEEIPRFNSLRDYFYELATYTNKYFLTKDTALSYKEPELREDMKRKKNNLLGDTVYYYIGLDEDGKEYLIAAQGLISHLLRTTLKRPVYVDEQCLNIYFNRLGKKALLYGVGVIEFFNRSTNIIDVTPPTTPTNLNATAASTSQIDLSWTASTGTVTGYKVYRSGSQVKDVPATSTLTSDTGLIPSTNYCYYVTAYNSAGPSAQSSPECATTQAPPVSPPSTPTGLTASATSSTQVNLSWTASTGTVTGYRVYKNGVELKTVSTTSTSDTGLNPSTNYCYYVIAYNSAGDSGQSSQACATTLSSGYSYAQIWPVFGGNAQHTGQASSRGPQSANLVMTSNVSIKSGTSAVIGSDKIIYVAGADNKLYAINPDGTIKWTLALTPAQSNPGGIRSAAISSDGKIYVVNGESLYAIRSNGSIEWDSKTFTQGSVPISDMNFRSDVTIYNDILYVGTTGGVFAAIMPDGSKKWHNFTYQTSEPSRTIYEAPTVGFNRLFIKDGAGNYGAFDLSNGVKDWWSFSPSDTSIFPLTIGSDGNLYIRDRYILWLIGYNNYWNGTYYDSSQDEYTFSFSGGVAISAAGTVYVGANKGNLYAFERSSGSIRLKWTFPAGGAIVSFPAIGSDGTIYFGADDGKVYAVDKNGNKKWEYTTGGKIRSALAIGPDGTLYVGSSDGKIYGFGGGSGGITYGW